MPDQTKPIVSLVVPCYNEAEVLESFYECASRVIGELSAYEAEFLFVDDGSTDGTAGVLRQLAERDARVKVIFLSRNFGHQRAITAGLDFCSGDFIIVMDADLQDPPELIPKILEKLESGFDLVHTVRSDRSVDSVFKRVSAKLFYTIMKRWVLPDLPENAGDFKGFNRKVLNALGEYRERVRFLRGAFATLGFAQTRVEFKRAARHSGTSKYPTWNMLRFARDAIVSNTVLPLRIGFVLGLMAILALPFFIAWAVYGMFTGAQRDPLLLVLMGMILLFSGLTLMMIGVLGEYIKALILETKQRPLYIVRESLGIETEK